MKEISYTELRSIQLDILQEVHNFCIMRGINYSLAYGTLLGAVRHKGYIPWDDDIDIAMLRSDYERFASEFNKESEILHFYDCRNDKDVNIAFGKVANTQTLVLEGANSKNLGVSIDIFPIDDLFDTYDDSKKYYSKFTVLKDLLVLKCRNISDVRSWWKKPYFACAKLIFFWFPLHQIPLRIIRNAVRRKNPNSAYVGLLVDGKENEIMERKIWSEFQQISFEGRMFWAIRDTDSYLKSVYGDYMILPPDSLRVPKHDFYKMYWLNNK